MPARLQQQEKYFETPSKWNLPKDHHPCPAMPVLRKSLPSPEPASTCEDLQEILPAPAEAGVNSETWKWRKGRKQRLQQRRQWRKGRKQRLRQCRKGHKGRKQRRRQCRQWLQWRKQQPWWQWFQWWREQWRKQQPWWQWFQWWREQWRRQQFRWQRFQWRN